MTWQLSLTGLVVGALVGLTGMGGVFFALTMLLAFPLKSAKVVGTDIFHAAALLWVAGAAHVAAGNVDLAPIGWLLAGSIPGVLIGSQFTVRVPEPALRAALAAILLLTGLELLDLPTGDQILLGALATGVVVGLGLLARAAVRRARLRRIRPEPG